MTRTWLGAVVAIGSLVVAGAVGCDGGETTGPGGGGSGATGGGGSGATGGGGSGATGGGGTMMTTTTTTPNDPCDGIPEGDFVPEWKPSTGLHQGLCTEAQIDELFAACLEAGATQATCDAFLMDAANKGCSTCVLSASDASEYGPIVVYQDLNLLYETPGQCISELEGDPSDASCGAKVYATIDCTVSACFDCGDMDYTALLKCLSTARQGYCKPYADAETACLADLAQSGLDVDVCLWDEQNEDYFVYAKGLSLLGCGP